jgi:futalosine hydrolase
MNIGDIGVATEEIQAELGLERPNSLLPDELPFDIVSLGKAGCKHRYPIESETVSKVHHQLRADSQCFVTTGPFVTVSTITATDNRMRAMEIRFAPIMESMEGAAVAQVCLHYGISFVEIRAASNRVGDRNRDSWNIPLACRRFAEAVVNCLTTFREMAEPRTRGSRFY